MLKLRFDLNRLLTQKLDDQRAALPVEKELNEQELASVTGGWAWNGGDNDDDEYYRHHHHHRRHS